jgi:hypothetical protein
MVDLAQIQRLLLRGQPPSVQKRLNRVVAKNAGFIGVRLTDVADAQETLNWFRIARQAARQAGDADVEAWIVGHTADAYSCYGQSLNSGLKLAQAAQLIGGSRPNSAAVFAYLAEAGIQARLGHRRETIAAVRNAEQMFNALPPTAIVADGIRIPEYFLRWHQSNALSVIGEKRLADPLRERALELPLSQEDLVGRALLSLDQASLLLHSGQLGLGCNVIKQTWDGLPAEFHVGQVPRRTTQIVDGLRPEYAASREVSVLRDSLRSVTSQPA